MELSAEQMDALQQAAENLKEIFENLKEKFIELMQKVVDVLTPFLKKAMKWIQDGWRAAVYEKAKAAGLMKCYHLAFYARKRRTRKKNLKRILNVWEEDDE